MASEIMWMVPLIIIGTFVPVDAVILTCSPEHPSINDTLTCTCINEDGNNVEWLSNGSSLTNCVLAAGICLQTRKGYTFSATRTTSNAVVDKYEYSYCAKYTCKDSAIPRETDAKTVWIKDFDLSQDPDELSQPGDHTSGFFNATYPCLFIKSVNKTKIVQTQWYKTLNGTSVEYKPKNHWREFDGNNCQTCNSVSAVQVKVSFYHTEAKPNDTNIQEVGFILRIFETGNPSNYKDIPFLNLYRISGNFTSTTTPVSNTSDILINQTMTTNSVEFTINPSDKHQTHHSDTTSPTTTLDMLPSNTTPNVDALSKLYLAMYTGLAVVAFLLLCMIVCCVLRLRKKRRKEKMEIKTNQELINITPTNV